MTGLKEDPGKGRVCPRLEDEYTMRGTGGLEKTLARLLERAEVDIAVGQQKEPPACCQQ